VVTKSISNWDFKGRSGRFLICYHLALLRGPTTTNIIIELNLSLQRRFPTGSQNLFV
jgi:hypothetical protein